MTTELRIPGAVWPAASMNGERDGARVSAEMVVAVVHGVGAVCFLAVAPSAERVMHEVADYVRSNAPDVLWARDAWRVRALLDAGETLAAVNHYFETVGQRWDKEWLLI